MEEKRIRISESEPTGIDISTLLILYQYLKSNLPSSHKFVCKTCCKQGNVLFYNKYI